MNSRSQTVLVVAALVLLTAPAAVAQSTNVAQPLTVKSTVPTRCMMSPPTQAGSGTNVTFAVSGANGEIDLNSFVDPSTAKTKASSAVIEFPIICTGPHILTVASQHGGLADANATGPEGGFQARADYSLTANWDGTVKAVTTTGSPATLDLSQTGPATGDLTLNFALAAGQGPLRAGSYSDNIVIQLNAQ